MARPRKDALTGDPAVRERLLSAALELFNAKGYAATSVREIVEQAGVSKPVLYYYFKSKEGIYLALMESAHATFQEVVSRITSAPGSACDRIIGFATGMFDSITSNIDVVRLIYAIFFGPPQGAPYFPHEQFFDAMLEIVAGMLKEGVGDGELKPVDIHVASWTIISCLSTLMEEQLCHDPPRIGREGLEQMIRMILDGIVQGGKE